MVGKKFVAISLVLLVISAGVVLAKESSNSMGYQVFRDSTSSIKLKITTDAAADGMLLGITLYPPNVKEGSSQLLPLKRGTNTQEISVAPSFKDGTFEVAVWTKKLSKQECEQSDEACRKIGYKLIGMNSYMWGYLITP